MKIDENHMIFLLKYGNKSELKEKKRRESEFDRKLNSELR